jgi:two-component system sensor histidine kinase DctS
MKDITDPERKLPEREPSARRPLRGPLLWAALMVLLLGALSLLVALTFHYRSSQMQQQVDRDAALVATELSRKLASVMQSVVAISDDGAAGWNDRAAALMLAHPAILRLERRDERLRLVDALDTRVGPRPFDPVARRVLPIDTGLACETSQRRGGPAYSQSYFVPVPEGIGQEVMDLCVVERSGDRTTGFITASYSLAGLLDELSDHAAARRYDLSMLELDGSMLARSATHVGQGAFMATHFVDLPGTTMQLRLDSAAGAASIVPDISTALVIGLSFTLFGLVVALARDGRKRARAEAAVGEALAFRKAMEDSVATGLRARDLQGRTTYVNPAFCAMVGFSADELMRADSPPYWPAEQVAEYQQRRDQRMADVRAATRREALETTFARKHGERFPVTIFEAPLLDSEGRHKGWMSAVLDVSAQRRAEEVVRRQQERLQAAARLATVGEMASLLSHELNQPLSAIAAYATGSLNMMEAVPPGRPPDPALWDELREVTRRVSEQAERAGRVIKSVHDFVRRREPSHEAVGIDALIDAAMPLVRLQAHKADVRIVLDVSAHVPPVVCDRSMVEQVLLNLARNGIQAMQELAEGRPRVLTLRVRRISERWMLVAVGDCGPGVGYAAASQLFTPFFTTRPDGMGLGLSTCRTIVDRLGGALTFVNLRDADGHVSGAEFRFTLPLAPAAADLAPPASSQAAAIEAEVR